MVHFSIMSGIDKKTFEDELWEGLDENTFRTSKNEKGRTITYGIWHSTRIEDITMNLLVAGDKQIFNRENWQERINSKIIDTGNAMSENEIMEFSKDINVAGIILMPVTRHHVVHINESLSAKKKSKAKKL